MNSDAAAAPAARWSAASLRFQQQLAESYERGHLTLAQVHQQLSRATYQLLYRSQATAPLLPEQLHELVQRARHANAAVQITGLLLYADGHFVQLLEGSMSSVQALFARISQDPRHQQVSIISMGLLPGRQFAEWSMDFEFVDAAELAAVLAAIRHENNQTEIQPDCIRLQKLLDSFVNTCTLPGNEISALQ